MNTIEAFIQVKHIGRPHNAAQNQRGNITGLTKIKNYGFK